MERVRKRFEGTVAESLSVSTFLPWVHLFGERAWGSPVKASASAALFRVPARAECWAFVLPVDRCCAIKPVNKEPQTPDLNRILSFTRTLRGFEIYPARAGRIAENSLLSIMEAPRH